MHTTQFECPWFFSTGLRTAQSNVNMRSTTAEPPRAAQGGGLGAAARLASCLLVLGDYASCF
eukprot:9479103-Pyramimonas_sp.AAC.1